MFEKLRNRVSETVGLYREIFSEGLLKSLKTNNIFITESLIKSQLTEKLAESQIILEEFSCVDYGMHVRLLIKKIGASLHYKALIKIDKIEITPEKHEATIIIESDDISGNKIWGSVVASLTRLILNSIVSFAISHSDLNDLLQYDEKSRKAIIDLRKIPQIDKLYKEQKVLGSKRIIDLFSRAKSIHFKRTSRVATAPVGLLGKQR